MGICSSYCEKNNQPQGDKEVEVDDVGNALNQVKSSEKSINPKPSI